MVRLEKILYEQLVNTKVFKRERLIGRPSKWYNEPRTPAVRLTAVRVFAQGLTGQLFRMVEPIVAKFTYQWQRDYLLQRGLAMEDMVVFQDRELRRDPFFEHIMRENFHPLTWTLYNKRRARYYKVERGVRGTYAPDWLRAEAEQRTLADSIENKDEWDSFVYSNYMSDITPTVRPSALQKLIFLEYFTLFGFLRPEAWDRLFYNEVFYKGTTFPEKDLTALPNPFSQYNLQTDDGRRAFEVEINRFIGLYPGAITKPGDKFDFQRFYALEALRSGKDVSRFDPQLLAQLRTDIEGTTPLPAAKKDRQRKSNSFLPGWMLGTEGKGLLSQ